MLLTQAKGWFMFVEIARLDGDFHRLVANPRHIVANGYTWQASGIRVDLPEESGDGELGEMLLSVSNVSRLPMAAVEVDDELLGCRVRVWLAHEDSFAAFSPGLMWEHIGLKVSATEKALTLACGHPAAVQRVPSRRYTRGGFPQLLPQGGVRTQ